MRFSVRLAALAAMLAAVAPSARAADVRDGRRIVWRDEFDGTGVNSAKWRFRKTMTANDCVYTNDERTVKVEGGMLRLRALPSGDPAKPWMLPKGLATHDTMGFRYGYLEMRARVPFRRGAWPSFWTQSTPILQKAPYMAEIDVFEVFSSTNILMSNLHKWQWPKVHKMRSDEVTDGKYEFLFKTAANPGDEFHVYGMEWTPEAISFHVDGELFTSFGIRDGDDFAPEGKLGMKGFHDFQSVIINNEIFTPGHGWCPPENAIRPEDGPEIVYLVDWVRLWQGRPGEAITVIH